MLPHPWDDETLRAALGFTDAEIEAAHRNETALDGAPGSVSAGCLPAPSSWQPLPYPGGRHPRSGFLEGAFDPQRETKLLFGVPDMGGYLVLDLPEAIWSDEQLIFLAHTHLPTVWDRNGERHTFTPWNISLDGRTAANSHVLPDGTTVSAEATRSSDSRIDLLLSIVNRSDHDLTDVWAQTCLMLAQADLGSTDTEIVLSSDIAALRLSERMQLEFAWEKVKRTWQNPPVPCMHNDPFLGSCRPGDTLTVRGSLALR